MFVARSLVLTFLSRMIREISISWNTTVGMMYNAVRALAENRFLFPVPEARAFCLQQYTIENHSYFLCARHLGAGANWAGVSRAIFGLGIALAERSIECVQSVFAWGISFTVALEAKKHLSPSLSLSLSRVWKITMLLEGSIDSSPLSLLLSYRKMHTSSLEAGRGERGVGRRASEQDTTATRWSGGYLAPAAGEARRQRT